MNDAVRVRDPLSPRECEVAAAYAEGRSHKQIARDLGISPTTVRTHLRTIYRKLGVTSKIALAHTLAGTEQGGGLGEGRDDAALVAELALELDEAIRRERVLANVLRIISRQGDDLESVIDAVLAHALEICEAEFGILFDYCGDLRFRAQRSQAIAPAFGSWLEDRAVFSVDAQTGLGRVATSMQTVAIADVRGEDIYRSGDPLRRATADLGGARSFAAIPMMSGERLLGVFTVYRTRVHPFNERALELVQLFSDQAAVAIQNTRQHADIAGANGAIRQTAEADDGEGRLLAVLPFQAADESDRDLTAFGRRLSASIGMELTSNPLIRLIDQASSGSETLDGLPPLAAAEVLGAGLVASGTIRRVAADGFRIAANLHQAGTVMPVWSERFDLHGREIDRLLEDLLPRLCAAIGVRVERQLVIAAQAGLSRNPDARDHFLRGVELHHRHNEEDFQSARVHFRKALRVDPSFGRAGAALAITYVREWFRDSEQTDLLEVAAEQARTAMGVAPHDAWVQTVWGVVALYRRHHTDAAMSFARAMELAPHDAYVVSRCALGKFYDGDFEAACDLFRRAIVLDPLHADRQKGLLGHALFHLGRYGEASEQLQAVADPQPWEQAWLAACFAMQGERDAARRAASDCRKALAASGSVYRPETRPFRRSRDLQTLLKGLDAAGLSEADPVSA